MDYDKKMMHLGGNGIHLRFYRFDPPAVTLGYLQKNHNSCNWPQNLDYIKRPTGGRAVFHSNDITYAVSCSSEIFEKKYSLIEFYNLIARSLLSGLSKMGIKADIFRRYSGRKYSSSINCFSSVSIAEIVVDKKKLIGSAQARSNNYILQHGSIPLTIDEIAESKLFGTDPSAFDERIALYDILDPDLFPYQLIIEKLTEGFADFFGGKVYKYNKNKE